jgi:hypothetical protein
MVRGPMAPPSVARRSLDARGLLWQLTAQSPQLAIAYLQSCLLDSCDLLGEGIKRAEPQSGGFLGFYSFCPPLGCCASVVMGPCLAHAVKFIGVSKESMQRKKASKVNATLKESTDP